MLSNHLHNGIEAPKLAWSRLPNSEDGEPDTVGLVKKSDESSIDSLDYEVIENYAYRKEQVTLLSLIERQLCRNVRFFWGVNFVCFDIYRRREGSFMLDIM